MKKSITLLLALLLLLAPLVLAPETSYQENSTIDNPAIISDSEDNPTIEESYIDDDEEEYESEYVEKIVLYGKNNVIEWEVEGYSKQGFKVVWSKEIGPEYPTRIGDKYHYFTEPERNRDELDAFDGSGKYFVRVCEYLGDKCGIYSNEIKLYLGEENEYEKEHYELEDKNYENDNKNEKVECNNGCLLNEVCYPLGYRIEGQFCSNNLTLIPQITGNEVCENNFECKSNLCVSGSCLEQGLIQKILSWLRSFFG